jgi:hypothetical protein
LKTEDYQSMTDKTPDSFRLFQNTIRALLAVPKKEIDEQAAKWKRRKNKNKKAPHGHIAS